MGGGCAKTETGSLFLISLLELSLTFLEKGEKDQAKTMTGCFLIRAPSSAWTSPSS